MIHKKLKRMRCATIVPDKDVTSIHDPLTFTSAFCHVNFELSVNHKKPFVGPVPSMATFNVDQTIGSASWW
eukprot:jgi/Botrbrau1/20368/Bobra.0006s0033.1